MCNLFSCCSRKSYNGYESGEDPYATYYDKESAPTSGTDVDTSREGSLVDRILSSTPFGSGTSTPYSSVRDYQTIQNPEIQHHSAISNAFDGVRRFFALLVGRQ